MANAANRPSCYPSCCLDSYGSPTFGVPLQRTLHLGPASLWSSHRKRWHCKCAGLIARDNRERSTSSLSNGARYCGDGIGMIETPAILERSEPRSLSPLRPAAGLLGWAQLVNALRRAACLVVARASVPTLLKRKRWRSSGKKYASNRVPKGWQGSRPRLAVATRGRFPKPVSSGLSWFPTASQRIVCPSMVRPSTPRASVPAPFGTQTLALLPAELHPDTNRPPQRAEQSRLLVGTR